TMLVQLAGHLGARVIGTARPAHHDHLRRLGAIPIAYGPGLVDRVRSVHPHGVDAAIDAAGGGEPLRASLDLVADRSRIGTLVDFPLAQRLGTTGIRAERSRENLRLLAALHETGALRVTVRARFPLDAAADAHREIERGHGIGKVVVQQLAR
ncbi:MAG: zinc-binding dehydrogenase, partial [Actinomycetes bacterium]